MASGSRAGTLIAPFLRPRQLPLIVQRVQSPSTLYAVCHGARFVPSRSPPEGTGRFRREEEQAPQFSREYRRLFGLPPLRDIERLRADQGGFQVPV